MVGGTRIITLGAGQQEHVAEDPVLAVGAEADDAYPDIEENPAEADIPLQRNTAWIAPALAGVAIAAWTGFYLWADGARLNAANPPSVWTRAIAEWSIPVLLICVLWLLAMRNSRREASRFGDVARLLSDESARLEARLLTVNRELSLAREFIASQSRDLDALGRMAVDRVSQNADRLQSLIVENSGRVDALGTVSAAALDNMEKLRGQLPVIASSAKDVTNNIGNAGRSAQLQVEQLVEAFNRLNSFGQASERQVEGLSARAKETIDLLVAQCDDVATQASARFETLADQSVQFREQLDRHEIETLAAIRTRASALGEELEAARQALDDDESQCLTSLRARVSSLRDEGAAVSRALRDGETRAIDGWKEAIARVETDESEAFQRLTQLRARAIEDARTSVNAVTADLDRIETALTERAARMTDALNERREAGAQQDAQAAAALKNALAAFDAELAARHAAQEEKTASITAQGEAVLGTLATFVQRMDEIAARSAELETGLVRNLASVSAHLETGRETLAATNSDVARLTDDSVRLLELIRASSEHSRNDLPAALAAGESNLNATEGRIAALREALAQAIGQGERLDMLADTSSAALTRINHDMETIGGGFRELDAAQTETLARLASSLSTLHEQSEVLTSQARGALSEALAELDAATRHVIAELGDNSAAAVAALAQNLAEESSAAMNRAMRNSAAEISGQLEQAAAHAAGVGREATIQLRDQLAKVNELAGNLERRVAQARERAEEQVDNDFSRRAALITESLNSNAIDIAKALSSEVSDVAWAAYLRGDRGIFTRRAVSLLDGAEAKAVTQVYENDGNFREHVSRYIHDFEAILRQVLSTRDGHALGVTLLSSDMGKLYVALAQAIERLRT